MLPAAYCMLSTFMLYNRTDKIVTTFPVNSIGRLLQACDRPVLVTALKSSRLLSVLRKHLAIGQFLKLCFFFSSLVLVNRHTLYRLFAKKWRANI